MLVNNAGVLLRERSLNEDGVESTFAVNHLGYFLVTNLLLELLKKSAPSRIVSVSSTAHKYGKIDIGGWVAGRDYSAFRRTRIQSSQTCYSPTNWRGRLQDTGVTANCLHPGGVGTNLFRGLPGFFRR